MSGKERNLSPREILIKDQVVKKVIKDIYVHTLNLGFSVKEIWKVILPSRITPTLFKALQKMIESPVVGKRHTLSLLPNNRMSLSRSEKP